MDIVERLRNFEATDCCSQRKEAADEIERLREELKNYKKLRKQLLSFVSQIASSSKGATKKALDLIVIKK